MAPAKGNRRFMTDSETESHAPLLESRRRRKRVQWAAACAAAARVLLQVLSPVGRQATQADLGDRRWMGPPIVYHPDSDAALMTLIDRFEMDSACNIAHVHRSRVFLAREGAGAP